MACRYGYTDRKGRVIFSVSKPDQQSLLSMEKRNVGWRVRAIRGATTVEENTVEAIQEAVTELLDELDRKNQLCPDQLISVTFSVTRDLDAVFPAAIARQREGWDQVPLLDVQQMHVEGALSHCIRFLIHAYLPGETHVTHPYLRGAKKLRPDLNPDLKVD